MMFLPESTFRGVAPSEPVKVDTFFSFMFYGFLLKNRDRHFEFGLDKIGLVRDRIVQQQIYAGGTIRERGPDVKDNSLFASIISTNPIEIIILATARN